MRFSLLELMIWTVILSVALGVGVSNARLSRELRTTQAHAAWLNGYSQELRQELSNAKQRDQETYAEINRWQKSGELQLKPSNCTCGCCGPFITDVDWKILEQPQPEIGLKHPQYND